MNISWYYCINNFSFDRLLSSQLESLPKEVISIGTLQKLDKFIKLKSNLSGKHSVALVIIVRWKLTLKTVILTLLYKLIKFKLSKGRLTLDVIYKSFK